mgnify:CR=1 FL=1
MFLTDDIRDELEKRNVEVTEEDMADEVKRKLAKELKG